VLYNVAITVRFCVAISFVMVTRDIELARKEICTVE